MRKAQDESLSAALVRATIAESDANANRLKRTALERELREEREAHAQTRAELERGHIEVLFDGPPGHESGRFVEVEDGAGHSINIGEWSQSGRYWVLTIPVSCTPAERKALEAARLVAGSHDNGECCASLNDELAFRLDVVDGYADALAELARRGEHLAGEPVDPRFVKESPCTPAERKVLNACDAIPDSELDSSGNWYGWAKPIGEAIRAWKLARRGEKPGECTHYGIGLPGCTTCDPRTGPRAGAERSHEQE